MTRFFLWLNTANNSLNLCAAITIPFVMVLVVAVLNR